MKNLKRRLIGLLLQPFKTPVLILEVILAIFDLTDREAMNSKSGNQISEGFGVSDVRERNTNLNHTQTIASAGQ